MKYFTFYSKVSFDVTWSWTMGPNPFIPREGWSQTIYISLGKMLKNIIKYHVKITTMKCFWVIYQTSITASRFVNSAVSRRNHEDRFFHYLIRFNLRFNPKLNQEMIDFSPLASNKLRGLGFKLQMTKYFDELVFYDFQTWNGQWQHGFLCPCLENWFFFFFNSKNR